MTRNQIKLLACLTMTIDHVGMVLFPHIYALRIIGRIAMPLFAFFIGEGCVYTRDRKKYFLRLFILALICQAVSIAESFITGSGNGFYLNILFTFSFSIILCCSFLDMQNNPCSRTRLIYILVMGLILLAKLFFDNSAELVGVEITLDYGAAGVFLPLFAVVSRDRKKKLISFSVGLLLFSVICYGFLSQAFFAALLAAPVLFIYNGKTGKMKLQYFFYLFYPLHIAAIYAVSLIM